jgi:RNA-directed DNA polymerase
MTSVHALERPLEAIVARENLQRAWQRVKANKGAAGVDAITVTDFPAWARQHWPTIKQQVLNGDYQPEAVRRVWIPKPNGDKRPLGIPNVTDRIIQQAMPKALRGAGSRATTRAAV